MARNERTSKSIGTIASQGLRAPSTLTNTEIKKLAASALTQMPDHKKAAPKGKKR